jgi:hypothetical protein
LWRRPVAANQFDKIIILADDNDSCLLSGAEYFHVGGVPETDIAQS